MTREERREMLRDVAEMLRDILECSNTPEEEKNARTAFNAVLAI